MTRDGIFRKSGDSDTGGCVEVAALTGRVAGQYLATFERVWGSGDALVGSADLVRKLGLNRAGGSPARSADGVVRCG
jgi:hypothetical protein